MGMGDIPFRVRLHAECVRVRPCDQNTQHANGTTSLLMVCRQPPSWSQRAGNIITRKETLFCSGYPFLANQYLYL